MDSKITNLSLANPLAISFPEDIIGVRSGSLNSSTGVGTIDIIISETSVAHFKSDVAHNLSLFITFKRL